MFAQIITLLTITSVFAIDKEFGNTYENICVRNGVELTPNFLYNLTNYYLKDNSEKDCRYPSGFHFSPDLCKSRSTYDIRFPYEMSAFLGQSKGSEFIYIFVLLGKNVIEIRPEEETIRSETKTFKVTNPWTIPKTKMNSLFVLWIKELVNNVGDSNAEFEVTYDSGQTISSNLKASHKVDDQLLLKDFKEGDIKIESKNFADNPISISHSYFIGCANLKFQFCKPIEENERIRCDCDLKSNEKDQIYSLIYVLGFLALSAIIVTKPLMEALLEVERSDKTIFVISVSCNERNYKYKDFVILRLAKDSPYADLKDVTIDYELFSGTPNNYESVAPEHRIKASVLETRPVIDIKIVMFRLTKLPELKLISVKHSGGPELQINLLGVMSQSGDSGGKIMVFKLNKHIVRNKRRFNLKPFTEGEDLMDSTPEEVRMKDPKMSQINLKILEVLFILFVVISVIATFAAFIHKLMTENVFLKIISMIMICTPVGIVFLFLFVLFYKCLLLTEAKQQTRMSSKNERIFQLIIIVFYMISIGAAIVANAYIYILIKTDKLTTFLHWFASVICSSALTGLFWSLSTHWLVWSSKNEMPSESEMTVNSMSINSQFV